MLNALCVKPPFPAQVVHLIKIICYFIFFCVCVCVPVMHGLASVFEFAVLLKAVQAHNHLRITLDNLRDVLFLIAFHLTLSCNVWHHVCQTCFNLHTYLHMSSSVWFIQLPRRGKAERKDESSNIEPIIIFILTNKTIYILNQHQQPSRYMYVY